jgi:hypothetical protein
VKLRARLIALTVATALAAPVAVFAIDSPAQANAALITGITIPLKPYTAGDPTNIDGGPIVTFDGAALAGKQAVVTTIALVTGNRLDIGEFGAAFTGPDGPEQLPGPDIGVIQDGETVTVVLTALETLNGLPVGSQIETFTLYCHVADDGGACT